MSLDQNTIALYTKFLHEELVPAMGCTEPIAIAYGAAYARKVLGNDMRWNAPEISSKMSRR